MKEKIDKVIRESYNKHLVRHVPIKNDSRCRTEIMFEEMVNNIIDILNENNKNIISNNNNNIF